MKKLNFCTLFDSNYLLRGLSLIDSLCRNENSFHLYILAMDETAGNFLTQQAFPNVTVIKLADFETPEILSVKSSRSKGEYCWTCTPFVVDFCLDKFQLDHCTYLDADIYFFSSPRILIEEVGNKSVLITKHNYSPQYDQSEVSGIYCVQFMYFKNSQAGREALSWWKDRCLEWCYARYENGKFGDQKYLDDWLTRFNEVHELEHLGGGVAPWNIQRYSVLQKTPLFLRLRKSDKTAECIFYHFHALKLYSSGACDLGTYKISSDVVRSIYTPYLASIETNKAKVIQCGLKATDYIDTPIQNSKFNVTDLRRRIKGNYNILNIKNLLKEP
jgi:hypothetical protein